MLYILPRCINQHVLKRKITALVPIPSCFDSHFQQAIFDAVSTGTFSDRVFSVAIAQHFSTSTVMRNCFLERCQRTMDVTIVCFEHVYHMSHCWPFHSVWIYALQSHKKCLLQSSRRWLLSNPFINHLFEPSASDHGFHPIDEIHLHQVSTR